MITSCFQYHVSTSHDRNRMGGQGLDWENQPGVFKGYPGLKPIPLPEPGPFPEKRLSELLRQAKMDSEGLEFDTKSLSTLLFLSYSLTGKARQGESYFYFRSVPSAGALYPAELYLLSNGLAGLDDGLYHFSIARHGLHLLRKGLFQGARGPGSFTSWPSAWSNAPDRDFNSLHRPQCSIEALGLNRCGGGSQQSSCEHDGVSRKTLRRRA